MTTNELMKLDTIIRMVSDKDQIIVIDENSTDVTIKDTFGDFGETPKYETIEKGLYVYIQSYHTEEELRSLAKRQYKGFGDWVTNDLLYFEF